MGEYVIVWRGLLLPCQCRYHLQTLHFAVGWKTRDNASSRTLVGSAAVVVCGLLRFRSVGLDVADKPLALDERAAAQVAHLHSRAPHFTERSDAEPRAGLQIGNGIKNVRLDR